MAKAEDRPKAQTKTLAGILVAGLSFPVFWVLVGVYYAIPSGHFAFMMGMSVCAGLTASAVAWYWGTGRTVPELAKAVVVVTGIVAPFAAFIIGILAMSLDRPKTVPPERTTERSQEVQVEDQRQLRQQRLNALYEQISALNLGCVRLSGRDYELDYNPSVHGRMVPVKFSVALKHSGTVVSTKQGSHMSTRVSPEPPSELRWYPSPAKLENWSLRNSWCYPVDADDDLVFVGWSGNDLPNRTFQIRLEHTFMRDIGNGPRRFTGEGEQVLHVLLPACGAGEQINCGQLFTAWQGQRCVLDVAIVLYPEMLSGDRPKGGIRVVLADVDELASGRAGEYATGLRWTGSTGSKHDPLFVFSHDFVVPMRVHLAFRAG